jgi:hypothetical protein
MIPNLYAEVGVKIHLTNIEIILSDCTVIMKIYLRYINSEKKLKKENYYFRITSTWPL